MKKGTVTYLVHEDGTLEVMDFQPRRFGSILKKQLPAGWESDPDRLAKALGRYPDLLTLVIGLMAGWQEAAARKRARVEEGIAKRTGELEAAASPGAGADMKKDRKLNALYARLAEWDDRIWAVDRLRPCCWLRKMNARNYCAVVEAVKKFLEQRVTDAWVCFSPALDSAQGRAVHDFRQLPADFLEALQVSFTESEGASLPLAAVTRLGAAQADEAARQLGLAARFVAVAPLVPEEAPGESDPVPGSGPAGEIPAAPAAAAGTPAGGRPEKKKEGRRKSKAGKTASSPKKGKAAPAGKKGTTRRKAPEAAGTPPSPAPEKAGE